MGVEFGEVLDLGHGRGPVALQMPHPAFHARLLLRPPDQAEERLERIVADQCLIALVESALAAGEQLRRHRLGVVPLMWPASLCGSWLLFLPPACHFFQH